MTTPVLSATNLTAGYGGAPVVFDVSLEVRPGEVVALLGANGAGKSTTLLTLAGELKPMSGQSVFGPAKADASLHRRAQRGLAYVPEGRSVFKGLTTRDNMVVSRVKQDEVLALFPELERRLSIRAGLLSGGEQQMLSLGRAIARRPTALLADELSLGLAPLAVTRLLEAVRACADSQGCGVLLVEQHVRKVLAYADRVFVMQRGRLVMSISADEALANIGEIEKTYLSYGSEEHESSEGT
jgi:branched-chain amino acid transport system ATP-binding protein